MLRLLKKFYIFDLLSMYREGWAKKLTKKSRMSSLSQVFLHDGFTYMKYCTNECHKMVKSIIYKTTIGEMVQKMACLFKSRSGAYLLPSPTTTCGCGLSLRQFH